MFVTGFVILKHVTVKLSHDDDDGNDGEEDKGVDTKPYCYTVSWC